MMDLVNVLSLSSHISQRRLGGIVCLAAYGNHQSVALLQVSSMSIILLLRRAL